MFKAILAKFSAFGAMLQSCRATSSRDKDAPKEPKGVKDMKVSLCVCVPKPKIIVDYFFVVVSPSVASGGCSIDHKLSFPLLLA